MNADFSIAGFQPESGAAIYSYGIPQDEAAPAGTVSTDLEETDFTGAAAGAKRAWKKLANAKSLTHRFERKLMKLTRRKFLAAGASATLVATVRPQAADPAPGPRPSTLDSRPVSDDALEQAAAQPVLELKGLNAPVIIQSIQLLKQGRDYFVRVRSQDGAEGIAVDDGHAGVLHPILHQLEMHPDRRVQQAVHGLFESFQQLGSARQVLLYHQKEHLDLPSEHLGQLIWVKASYSRVLAFLSNPAYAGTFVYGRRQKRKMGQPPSGRGRTLLRDPKQWPIVIHDHHPGYIQWEAYERNPARSWWFGTALPPMRTTDGAALRCSGSRCRRTP